MLKLSLSSYTSVSKWYGDQFTRYIRLVSPPFLKLSVKIVCAKMNSCFSVSSEKVLLNTILYINYKNLYTFLWILLFPWLFRLWVFLSFRPFVNEILKVIDSFNLLVVSIFDVNRSFCVFIEAHIFGIEIYKLNLKQFDLPRFLISVSIIVFVSAGIPKVFEI